MTHILTLVCRFGRSALATRGDGEMETNLYALGCYCSEFGEADFLQATMAADVCDDIFVCSRCNAHLHGMVELERKAVSSATPCMWSNGL